MPDESRETTPPGPEEFLKGNVAGRPGVALPTEKTKEKEEKEEKRKIKLGPTKPVQNPIKKRGYYE